jgi:PAP2 superfamily.
MGQPLATLVDYLLRIDVATMDAIVAARTPFATKVLTSVTGLGSATAALCFVGVCYLADWDEEFRRSLLSLAICGVVVGVLMLSVERAFPAQPVCLTDGAETVASSFPSGHAAAVTVYAMTARDSDALPFATLATLATLVAVSRVYLGTHYLTDTVAGVAIGVGAFLLAGLVLERVDVATLSGRAKELGR